MTPRTYPALRYPGAKWDLAAWIISHFPAHAHYIEPYFGSGDVVNLFRVVREQGENLAELIDLTPYSRAEYYRSYERTGDPVEQARRFLVRCGQAHGFKPYCRTGWRHNGSKSLQPVTNRWARIPDSVRGMMHRLKEAEIECLPALAIIERYNTANTLLYADRLAGWGRATTTTQAEKGGTRTEVLWINAAAMAAAPLQMMEVGR